MPALHKLHGGAPAAKLAFPEGYPVWGKTQLGGLLNDDHLDLARSGKGFDFLELWSEKLSPTGQLTLEDHDLVLLRLTVGTTGRFLHVQAPLIGFFHAADATRDGRLFHTPSLLVFFQRL